MRSSVFIIMGGVLANLFLCAFIIYKTNYYKSILARFGYKCVEPVEQRPDYWCVKSWLWSLQKMNISCDVCFFGHSQIASSNFQKDFPKVKIVELGYAGDDILGMIQRVPQIVAVKPTMVFVLAGTNSLHYPKKMFESEYDKLISTIRLMLPNIDMVLFNIIPQCDGKLGKMSNNKIIRERNLFMKDYAKNHNIPVIDLYSLYVDERTLNLNQEFTTDGVHLNNKAYSIWSKALEKYIITNS